MESIWLQTTELPRFPALENNITCDVLIIGGGITGLLTALYLHNKGIDYILVEKGRIAHGTTANTTAKITFQHGLCYNKLLKQVGLESAQMYLKANQSAFDELCKLAKSLNCDFEWRDNFVYSVTDRKKLENEMKALSTLGFNAELCDRPTIPIETVGAVKFKHQAQFNPLKFLKETIKDLNIYENTWVREMIGTTAVTDRVKIKAQKIIVATHFPFINKHGSYFLKQYQHRSYVVALENAQDVYGMYVDECKTGLSFRNYNGLLLLGGGGHRTGKNGGKWAELRRFYKYIYPDTKEITFWAAQDCMSLDSVPYIGRYSKNTPNMYVATGFNKWGMTGSMLSAMLLSDMLLDRVPDYAVAFNPSRGILKPQLAVNGFEAAKGLLTISQKQCPHLGCALKWNKAEHSWDCACHGSRFDENGAVLDNPANGNLSK